MTNVSNDAEQIKENCNRTLDTPALPKYEIASAGQTFSHGLKQSGGQSSGLNSDKKVLCPVNGLFLNVLGKLFKLL